MYTRAKISSLSQSVCWASKNIHGNNDAIRRLRTCYLYHQRCFATQPIDYTQLPPVSNIRNFGISAHVDSGKTTLTERILFYTGRIDQIHEIQGADGVGAKMDSMELEREKGITIQSAATFTQWTLRTEPYHLNIIDTPGHVDFQIEVERSLRVLDGAVLLVCAVNGVQSQTLTVDRQMRRYNVPRIIFINKLDRGSAEPDDAIAAVRKKLGLSIAPTQVPIGVGKTFEGLIDVIERKAYAYKGDHGQHRVEIPIPVGLKDKVEDVRNALVETLADSDEILEEAFVTGFDNHEGCPAQLIHDAIRRTTHSRRFIPVLMGSAKGNKGVQDLLDAVCLYLPSAEDVTAEAYHINDPNKKVALTPNPKKKTIAMGFKIQEMPPHGRLTYIKVYQGTVRKATPLVDVETGKKIQWKKMFRLHSDEAKEIPFARAGDIVALSGLDVSSGTSLIEEPADLTLSNMYIPNPVISVAVTLDKGQDASKFTKALQRFQREDPTFIVNVDPETKEYVMSGMGELHLDIYKERIKREYGLKLTTGTPKVNLREVVTKRVNFDYTHKRQTGGRGEWARICGYFEPIDGTRETLPPPEFHSLNVGSAIPAQYMTSIRKGFFEATEKGPLSGFPVVNIRLVIEDGATHEIDSSDLAFRNCVKKCFETHYSQLSPVILEPIMKIEIACPIEFAVSLQATLSQHQILILDTATEGETRIITAEAPLRVMFGFVSLLRQEAKGQGEFSMRFDRYMPAEDAALYT